MTKKQTERQQELDEVQRRFARALGRSDATTDHLDSVRLRLRASVAPEQRRDVFEREEITGVTEIPLGLLPT